MSLSNPVIHKKKRGPPATGKTPLVALRLPETLGLRVDEWIATQPDPRPSRSEAIRRLLAQALGNQETAAVALELFAPTTSKSEDLLRAAILALADEIANDPDDGGDYFDGYEARVRQVASSPSISQQSLVNFVDNELHRMKAAGRRRKK
jgi:Arc/MetJ-type ribon-helix-helix transcriptional regulator